jgi:hypothetical protein
LYTSTEDRTIVMNASSETKITVVPYIKPDPTTKKNPTEI